METERLPRKLAAILYADVAGYSRLTGADEDATHRTLRNHLDFISDGVERHHGRVVHYAGDAVLAVFGAVVDALATAVMIQRELKARNESLPEERKVMFRMGVNLGDVIEDRGEIYGDGVNVAARLEALADAGGICLSESVRTAIGNKLPLEYEFMGEQKVKNIAEPIRAYRVCMEKSSPPRRPGSDQRDRTSIAVLPFENMSGDPDQEYFADGLTEDIITALAKNRWLLVIARNSVFAFKGKSADVRRIAEELGANYVVEGSVRKAGNRVRITAQLIDAVTGKHIWAERYDRDLEDIFAVQDEITGTVAATVEPELGSVEQQRAQRKSPQSLDAWDCYHLGLSHMYKFNKEDNAKARRLFRKVISLDSEFGTAYARLAYCIIANMVYFDAEPALEDLDEALQAAKTAVALDDRDAVAHFALGRVRLARREYDSSVDELETSIELNPCLAQAHCGLGDALAYAGRLNESIQHFEEAIRLSPHDPYRWGFMSYRSLAHLFLKQYEEAATWARKAMSVPNSQYWAKAHLVAALGYLDRDEETREAVTSLLKEKPEFSLSFARGHLFYIKSSDQIECYLEGLRKAGIPE